MAETNIFHLLFLICYTSSSCFMKEEVVQKRILHLLKKQPDAAKQKNQKNGLMPLHWAIYRGSPFEVVAALIKAWPQAVKEKDIFGRTPLHRACYRKASFEVTSLLLNTWLSYIENRTKSLITSFQRYTKYCTEDVNALFFSPLFLIQQ
mmetsp:Transcript_27580/g.39979  ORF Transcript_27580/g.39979 Transcript_27580/m.39979 type:complete len:149 (-) Transcript_27580:27-473(-)